MTATKSAIESLESAEYAIEICGPNNQSHVFAPLGERLRGRWRASAVSKHDKSEWGKAIASIDVIPGKVLILNFQEWTLTVAEPLLEDENLAHVRKQINEANEQYPHESGGKKEFQKTYTLLAPEDKVNGPRTMKNWAYHMARAVESGHAINVDGYPKMFSADVAKRLPGDRTRDIRNTGRQENDLKKYTDKVQVPTKYTPQRDRKAEEADVSAT